MALIRCDECEKEYSDKAEACPQCGCPVPIKLIDSNEEQFIDLEKKKLKEKPPCTVYGDEVAIYYNEDYQNVKLGNTTTIIIFSISFVLGVLTMDPLGFFIFGSIALVLLIKTASIIHSFSDDYKSQKIEINNKLKEIKQIKAFFERTIPILGEIKSDFKTIEVVHESGKTKEEAMFHVYMKAYLLDADAIILNSDTITTDIKGHVSSSYGGRVKGKTTSVSVNNIMATLVRL